MSRLPHQRLAFAVVLLLVGCGGSVPPRGPILQPSCPDAGAFDAGSPPSTDASADAAAVTSTETVVFDGIPEVPAALTSRLNRYLNTRSASLQSLSDDGRALLITTRFHETAQLHRLVMPGGDRQQITFSEEPIGDGEIVPGDTSSVLYTSDVGGNEQIQLYRLHVPTGATTLLTDGTSRHGAMLVSHDGQRVAYHGNARNGRDFDIYVGDGRARESGRLILERSGHWEPIAFSRDNRQIILQEWISVLESRLFVLDVQSREVRRISPETPAASYRQAIFSADGTKVYATTDREGDFVELHEMDIATNQWRRLTSDIHWNVEEIALSPDGRTLALTTNEDGYSVLRLLDTRTRRARLVPGIPRGVLVALKFARRAPVLGFTLMSPTAPGDVYTYDLRRRAVVRWTASEVGGLDRTRFVEPTLVRYRTFDDREIPAFLYRPSGTGAAGPVPVVIDIHGGPESQARPYFSPNIQMLVGEAGFAVLVPNVRGSDGYGKSYLALDDGRRREDSVRDIGALLDWIRENPALDSNHVAVSGGSYGGYMVLASLVHFGDRLRAGVDVVGIANFLTFLENTAPYRRDLRRVEYGDERDASMRDFLVSISPTTHASRIRSALFVAHGANDPRVPAAEAEQIVRAVRQNGREVWYMLARNEGHGFQRRENRDAFAARMLMFLERHLR